MITIKEIKSILSNPKRRIDLRFMDVVDTANVTIAVHEENVRQIAEIIRKDFIIPHCKKHGYTFLSHPALGTYNFMWGTVPVGSNLLDCPPMDEETLTIVKGLGHCILPGFTRELGSVIRSWDGSDEGDGKDGG